MLSRPPSTDDLGEYLGGEPLRLAVMDAEAAPHVEVLDAVALLPQERPNRSRLASLS